MPFDTHTNFAYSTVTVVPSPATTGTTLSISNSDAANFPDPAGTGNQPYNVTVWPSTGNPNSTNAEIIRITAKGAADSGGAGNTQFTITRIQESTTARSILVGDQIANTETAKTLKDIENNINTPIINEVPTGTINGTNAVFTTASAYIGGTLEVFLDGLLQKGGGTDYTETTPTSGTFTFTTAPTTGSVVVVSYFKVAPGSGVNAATLNGYTANATPTANEIPVLDSSGKVPAAAMPNLITVPNTLYFLQSSDAANITTERAITGLSQTFTPSQACHVLIDAEVNFGGNTGGGYCYIVLNIDGSDIGMYAQVPNSQTNLTANLTWSVALTAASHTIAVYAATSSSSAVTISSNRAFMRILVIN